MSKSDERRKAILTDEQAQEPVGKGYRYVCNRCTNTAFQSLEKRAPQFPQGHNLMCLSCLKPVELPITDENFIAL
jgi:hypothetical protein